MYLLVQSDIVHPGTGQGRDTLELLDLLDPQLSLEIVLVHRCNLLLRGIVDRFRIAEGSHLIVAAQID